MTDAESEAMFRQVRWPETKGEPVCPHCGSLTVYDCRRPNGAPRWRCKDCKADFSITSGTLFAFHKMQLRAYLAAVAIFCNEVKGKSMLALSRDLGVQYKSAFVLAHKLREAMASDMRGVAVGGEGKVAEIDGGYFGGYVKPANRRDVRKGPPPIREPFRQAAMRRGRTRARRAYHRQRVSDRSSGPRQTVGHRSPAGRAYADWWGVLHKTAIFRRSHRRG